MLALALEQFIALPHSSPAHSLAVACCLRIGLLALAGAGGTAEATGDATGEDSGPSMISSFGYDFVLGRVLPALQAALARDGGRRAKEIGEREGNTHGGDTHASMGQAPPKAAMEGLALALVYCSAARAAIEHMDTHAGSGHAASEDMSSIC